MNTLDLHTSALRLCEFHCEIKEIDAQKRVIRGYASTSAIDRYNEIVSPKAFKDTMEAFSRDGVTLLHHNPYTPLGPKLIEHEIGRKGLWIEAPIGNGIHPLDHHEQAWNEITQFMLRGLSIGFRIRKDEPIDPNSDEGKAGAYRRILDLELYEISVVTIPANRETMFAISKALQFGSDAPTDIYKRNYWPDEIARLGRKDALDSYWSGHWPDHTDEALRSVALGSTESENEGVQPTNDPVADAHEVVALQVQTAALRARV